MGAGKSLISKELSRYLKLKYIDLDFEITQLTKLSIPEIFEKYGDLYFRKQEYIILNNILSDENDFVLSLGGGTPAYYNNMDIINKNTESIFLQANINTLYERLLTEKEQRPLIKKIKNDDLKEFIAKHLFERSQYYSLAKHTIIVDGLTPNEIVSKITSILPS